MARAQSKRVVGNCFAGPIPGDVFGKFEIARTD
jgi:hypothetical protein